MPSARRVDAAEDRPSFTRRAATATWIVVAVGLAVALLITIANILLLLFAGILLAVFLRSCARLLAERTFISSGWGVLLVVLVLLLVSAGGIALTVPHAVGQFAELGDKLAKAFEQIVEDLERTERGRQVLTIFPDLSNLQGQAGAAINNARGIFSTTLGALLSFFLIVIIGLYLAADPQTYVKGLLAIVPTDRRDRVRQVLVELRVTLFRWLVGRILEMIMIGVSTSIGLLLLGIPMPFTLGLLAALLTFIPNIGPVVSAVPAVLLALMQGVDMMIWVVVLYTGIQIVESYLLTPLVVRRTVSLPPVLTMVFQVVMGLYLGLMGVLMAAPVAASILVLVKIYYIHDQLDDEVNLRRANLDEPSLDGAVSPD